MKLDYRRIDPELAPVLDALPKHFGQITRENLITVREELAAQRVVSEDPDVEVDLRTIPGPNGEVPVYIYRSPGNDRGSGDAPQAGLLWLHGGGYILGSGEDDRAQKIAKTLKCTVVSVDYRLAPEHPFPAGPEDCYAALLWMAEHAGELGIDSGRLAIGGASAGGGMAAGVALMNRDRGGPALAFQLLLYPMIDNLHATPSGQIENHPIWDRAMSFRAWEMYLGGEPGMSASAYAAAMRADDLTGLPPGYVCVGAEDLFRDEDIGYARRLNDAGVACELAVFPGMYHGADVFVPQAQISQHLQQSFLDALKRGVSG